MAKKTDTSVENRLRLLYRLQLVDSKIDDIINVRGELPLEIEDLEDEIAGLETRLTKLNEDIENLNTEIKGKKIAIEDSKNLSKKYEQQQGKVRNNREFDSLTKEIEYQDLEIQLSEKRIREFKAKIVQKEESIEQTNSKLEATQSHYNHKKSELDEILKENEKEEVALKKLSQELSESIDAHLLKAYKRIRSSVKNGLAVVTIEREAATGSYFKIPLQIQNEIRSRKKITIDEHSGRILVDRALAKEEIENLNNILK